jgi:SAM-dependent methyltransferase
VFSSIYGTKQWGVDKDGRGTSGTGSTEEATKMYRTFLQEFLKNKNIRSVVDVGCGDWSFSRYIDWTGISYSGLDVVESVIQRNSKLYSSNNIRFILSNCLTADLPRADLLICKEVLQHLPNEAVQKILIKSQRFSYCIFVDDIYEKLSPRSINQDIKMGDWRPIDLRLPPFNVKAVKIMTYSVGTNVKQVLLVKN